MKRKQKYEVRTDCKFYESIKHDCKALKCLYCAIEEKPCKFFKPRITIYKQDTGNL